MGLAEYEAAVLASSPRAYWQMDEASGLAQDSSGNGLNMTTTNAAAYQVAGPFAGFLGMTFNAGSVASRAAVSSAANNMTIEMFVCVRAIGASNAELFRQATAWSIWVQDASHARQPRVNAGGTLEAFGSAFTFNVWTHFVVTRRAGTWIYFRDGATDVANAGGAAPGATFTTTQVNGSNMQATYSQVAYYETSLSDATILAHYNAALASGADLVPAAALI